MVGVLVYNSGIYVFTKQFNNSKSTLGFPSDNITGIKSAENLIVDFSNSYSEDEAATQQYFRYLLPGPPMLGHVQ